MKKGVSAVIPVNPIKIGKIGRAYGILGWVRILSFTDRSDNIFYYTPWFVYFQCAWKLIYLDTWKLLGNRYIAKIKNISNRNSANLLAQCSIVIEMKKFPCLENDEYYCKDLIGCVVITNYGKCLGCVVKIIETTAHDVLVIKIHQKNIFYKERECLIPFVQDSVIKTVNINTRVITVNWDIYF